MITEDTIKSVTSTLKPKFNITPSQNGNFRVQLEIAEMKRLKAEPQMRAFLELADALRAKDINCELRTSFKGSDGEWVHYPSLWVNQPTASKGVDEDTIKRAVREALEAYKASESAAPTEEPPAQF